jgi:hypothetical protein
MEQHEITLTITVRIDAPTESDAFDVIQDTFGEGSACGVDVVGYEVTKHVGPR